MRKLKTAEEAKAEIQKTGTTVSKWATKNGLSPAIVGAVLRGELQGQYGEAHKAAVLLGMKEGEITDEDERMRA